MIKTYLGERNVRCRNWPDCEFLGVPAVETERGFYCYQCASIHIDENIRICAEKSKTYRQGQDKQEQDFAPNEDCFPLKRAKEDFELRIKQLLTYLRENPDSTKKDVCLALKISLRTLDNYIARLKRIGLKVSFQPEQRFDYKSDVRALLDKDGTLKPSQVAARLGVSLSTARNLIKQIKEENAC